jgi:hypothetical protein
MRFARTVFTGAGLWGLVVLVPLYFMVVLEKFIYVISLSALYLQGRLAAGLFAVAGPDLVLGIFFIVSYFKVEAERPEGA